MKIAVRNRRNGKQKRRNDLKTRRMIENHMPTQHGLDTQCRP